MRMTHFRVDKYRSIRTSEKIPLGSMTVLVGPNNEGKSNILRALAVGLEVLAQFQRGDVRHATRTYVRTGELQSYTWSNDFPMDLQGGEPNGKTAFEFDFELTDDEVKEFKKEIRSSVNGLLRMKVTVGSNRQPEIRVIKRGSGSNSLNGKAREICEFISGRLTVDYIPAVRSSEDVTKQIRRDLDHQTVQLATDPEMRRIRGELEDLYRKSFEPYEQNLLATVREFLPDTKAVELSVTGSTWWSLFSPQVDLLIDDGALTNISAKGDGIQSLTMLALRKASLDADVSHAHILALEEPEAHLHPAAIKKLGAVISEISTRHQVVVATHNPLLVTRMEVGSNILVVDNRARAATSLHEVRELLGVELPDNLHSAETVLLTEGDSDAALMRRVLSQRHPTLRTALSQGRLRVEGCGGSTNMGYNFKVWSNNMCRVHFLLDGDKDGHKAHHDLVPKECDDRDITMVTHVDYAEAELEDMLDLEKFSTPIQAKFNVKLNELLHHETNSIKFSERAKRDFLASGAAWDNSVKSRLKSFVCEMACRDSDPTCDEFDGVLDSLSRALHEKLRLDGAS